MRSLPSVRAVQATRTQCLLTSKPRRSFVIQLRAGTRYVLAAPPTVIMFKSYWLAVVLAGVIGLSVMTDAQSCAGSADLLDVVSAVETLASNQQLITSQVRDGISGVRKMIASECEKANETTMVNETRLEAIVEEMKGEIADEIRDVKRMIVSGCEEANETRLSEIEKVVKEMNVEISGVKNETDRVLDVLENVVNAIKTIA